MSVGNETSFQKILAILVEIVLKRALKLYLFKVLGFVLSLEFQFPDVQFSFHMSKWTSLSPDCLAGSLPWVADPVSCSLSQTTDLHGTLSLPE